MKNETIPSPGSSLATILEERGMKNVELAALLGRSPQYVTDIIKGKKAMDVELAVDLELALGGSPTAAEWMQMVLKHHLSTKALSRAEVLQKPYAKELIRMGWIDGKLSTESLAQAIDAFWDDREKAVANFKQGSRTPDADARAAWSIEVYRRAMKMTNVGKYDERRFPVLIERLHALMADEKEVVKVPDLLAEFGIRLVLLPNPQKCAVDGLGYYNEGAPYVGLSLRIGRVDSFWFTLMHELMHIKAKDKLLPADTIDRPADLPAEKKANEGARNLLIPDSRYEAFVDRGVFTLPAVTAETEGHPTHPVHRAILLGRLKNDLYLDWSQFAREHTGIRDLLMTRSAV